MYHISRFPKQKRKGIQKNRTILYGLYVRGKSDLNIEVPYGPMNPLLLDGIKNLKQNS